jgi:hypothetical protein
MKKILLLICFCMASQFIFAQAMRMTLEKTPISIKADNANAVYIIDSDQLITKYNAAGKKVATYSNQKYGQISKIDVSSPFQTLVYYGNANVIVFLDSSFDGISELALASFGKINVNSLAMAADKSGFYLFDENTQSLNKYDVRGNNIGSVVSLQMPIDNLLLNGKDIYIQTGTKLILTDVLGQTVDAFSLGGATMLDFYKDKLIGTKENKLVEIKPQIGETSPLDLPFKMELSDKIFVRDKLFVAY